MKKRKIDDDKENKPPLSPLQKKKKFTSNLIIPPPSKEIECASPLLPLSPGTPCSPYDQELCLPTINDQKTNPDCNTISSETVCILKNTTLSHFS